MLPQPHLFLFFFNDTATTEIYTLSLHDALPIFPDVAIESDHDQPLRRNKWRGRSPPRAAEIPDASQRNRKTQNRSEEHTSELQSHSDLVCRLLLEKKKSLTKKILEHSAMSSAWT